VKVREAFESLRVRSQKALVAFITAGDPSAEATAALLREIDRAGADVIELGVPFSDPLADGPTIQASSQRALAAGICVEAILDIVRGARADVSAPIVLMTYYNPVLYYGLRPFARDCVEVGVNGVLISDLPPEEARDWCWQATTLGVETVFLLAPTSTQERIRQAVNLSTGFVYCVSRTGVTGARDTLSEDLEHLVRRVRTATDKPIAVGFGISTPEQVAAVCRIADGAIVGSAIVNLIAAESALPDMIASVGKLIRALKSGTTLRSFTPADV
jgi:tryptophan synthase alpha chain